MASAFEIGNNSEQQQQVEENEEYKQEQQEKGSPLLRLPPELRTQIYTYALCDDNDSSQHRRQRLELSATVNQWISPALCRTNRQIRNETLAMYYASHCFVYELSSPIDRGVAALRRVLESLRGSRKRHDSLFAAASAASAASNGASCCGGVQRCGDAGIMAGLGKLSFLHVNSGVQTMQELVEWVRLFGEFRGQLPRKIGMVFWPIRRDGFALAAAKALVDLANEFAAFDDVDDDDADDDEDEDANEDADDANDDGCNVSVSFDKRKSGREDGVGGIGSRIREFLDSEGTRKELMDGLRRSRGYVGREAGMALGWKDEF